MKMVKASLMIIFIAALVVLIAHQLGLDVGIADVVWISTGGILVDIYNHLKRSNEGIAQLMKNALLMTSIAALLALIAHQFGMDVGIVDVALISAGGILVDSYNHFRKRKGAIDQQLSSRSTAGNADD